MRLALKLHPDSARAPVAHIEVDVARPRPGHLRLHFVATGRIAELCMPPPATAVHTDGLWRHTCFEAFIRPSSGNGYWEFNLAPSAQWAAYRFDGYRSGMRPVGEAPTLIGIESTPERYGLQAVLDLERLPGLAGSASWRLGLAAVIEDMSGHRSYWALAHPPGQPDFHHLDCFACELAAA